VLVAFIVLTDGLLGTVALQSNAKQASYDANQRSAALALANDIVERIRANDTADIVANYSKTFSYLDTPVEKKMSKYSLLIF
jgi:type IV pilus assembly protein PilV